MILNIIVGALMVGGFIFYLAGVVGIIRFPDFYTRLHAAGKLDTLGALIMLGALALLNFHELNADAVQTALKILLAVVFVFLSSPTATHAIVDAGLLGGLPHWQKNDSAPQAPESETAHDKTT